MNLDQLAQAYSNQHGLGVAGVNYLPPKAGSVSYSAGSLTGFTASK